MFEIAWYESWLRNSHIYRVSCCVIEITTWGKKITQPENRHFLGQNSGFLRTPQNSESLFLLLIIWIFPLPQKVGNSLIFRDLFFWCNVIKVNRSFHISLFFNVRQDWNSFDEVIPFLSETTKKMNLKEMLMWWKWWTKKERRQQVSPSKRRCILIKEWSWRY